MGNMTVEQKLEMIRRARELSSQNSNTLSGRQRIMNPESDTQSNSTFKINFFKVKILIAIVLFLTFAVLDFTKGNIFSVKSSTIYENITSSIDIEELKSQVQTLYGSTFSK